jgi:ribosomal protein S18 acetylase RimI-like enzyme
MLDIQKAELKDIDRLCELLDELFSLEVEFIPNKELQSKGLQTIIESDSLGDIFVVKTDKKVVAMVNILYTYSTALGAPVAIFEDMIVDKDYRGEKIATKLMEYVQNYLKENGFKRLTLLTDLDNIKAQEFYKKSGFEKSSMIPFRKIL